MRSRSRARADDVAPKGGGATITTVLITGATGFVGGALLARLTGAGIPVVAIVRAESREEATGRLARSLARFVGPRAAGGLARSVPVLVGDLASDQVYGGLDLDGVSHVVHAAACTSFASTREVWRSNLEGTRKLAARMLRVAALRRFLYVGTAYCCGDRPRAIVHEVDGPRTEHGHVNAYAQSKAAAELLLASMAWNGRLLVARPSVVVGHTQLGVGPSSSLFWYYRALAALRCGPFSLDDRRDIVPVDYVAEALHFLLGLARPKFGVYHVSAGAAASQPLGDILRALGGAAARGAAAGWQKVSAATLAQMRAETRQLVADDGQAAKLAGALAACARFGELGVQWFDNDRLLAEDFRPPPSFTEYAGVCLRTGAAATIFEQLIDDA